ncbi:MAG: DoxX family protein [Candidatus Eremiobacteraeota bacterium]|nr:DoxX family protein [Candidatus Eremiobacteraeota bacterium]
MAAHGTQKLFGWFGGPGLAGTSGFFESLGFRPGRMFALAAALSEMIGGLLIALGWLGPIGPGLVIIVMVAAALTVHVSKGFFQSDGGWELNGMIVAAVLPFAFVGFGAYALDAVAAVPAILALNPWLVIAVSVVLGFLNVAARRKPAA